MTNRVLGKNPARLDRRTLKIERYTAALPPPPTQCYFQQKVKDWGAMLNDSIGCCTISAAGHMIEQWSTYAGNPMTPVDSQILTAYEEIGGYVPGDPSTDNGCVMLDVLNTWRKTGIAGRKIMAYATVFPDRRGVGESVSLFGNCYLGIQLPLSAQNQNSGWYIDDSDPQAAVAGSWGGHCVPIVGYSPAGVTVVTWGQLLNASWNFLARYADEAYAVLSQDWIESSGLDPTGFPLATLEADLAKVTAP
jgi:hypothetical protein